MDEEASRDERIRSTKYRPVELPLALSDAPIVEWCKDANSLISPDPRSPILSEMLLPIRTASEA